MKQYILCKPKSPKTRKWLLLSLFCCIPFIGIAQQRFGGNPPSTQWMQVKNDSISVIFPKGYKHQALRAFNTSLYMDKNERSSIGDKSQKLNIILQPETVISNGFVALAPFRAVFQTTPPPGNFSLGTTNWISELGIHETWHALQNMNFRTGIGRTFYTLFGGVGQSLITSLFIPNWYWEGDAVFMETQLTDQGRGRLPDFMAPSKSIWLSNRKYSFAKIRNGSLKDIVPNDYAVGYMMAAYGRDHYGYNFWHPVLQEALLNRKFIKQNNKKHPDSTFHLFKYGIYPLNAALKYRTGKNTKQFYFSALSQFKQTWEKEQNATQYTHVDTLKTVKTNQILNYRYPTVTTNGILALKYGYAQLPQIVRLKPDGKEETLVRIGTTIQNYYSYGGHKITWAEYRPDSRWGWKSYSVIRISDLTTGKTRTLSHKSKYFSPALSHDGEKIIAVKSTKSSSKLILLNANNGHQLKVIPNPHHYFYTYPVFAATNDIVIAGARDTLSNMALVKINTSTGEQVPLTPFAPKSIGVPKVSKDYIYFPASFKNEIQLYALRRKDQAIFKIADRPMGDYSLTIDTANHTIIFDEYTTNGFKLLSSPLNTNNWQIINKRTIKKVFNPYVPNALTYNKDHSILKDISLKDYPSSRYSPLNHLFNVHSWAFTSIYPDVGLALQSQDLIGTLKASAGAGYNLNENTPFVNADISYGGLFPFLLTGAKKTFGRSEITKDSTTIKWDEMSWYLGFQIPLDLSGGLYQRAFSFSGTIHQNKLSFKNKTEEISQHKNVTYYTLGLSFNNLRNLTKQSLNPKFGISLSTQYNQTLGKNAASRINSTFNLFLPGVFPTHTLYLTSAFSENINTDIYKFSDDFSYAHGYHSVPYKDIYTLGVNYQLPLFYPDVGLTWAYLLRIRLHAFFNYSHAKLSPALNQKYGTFRSAGLSLYFDTHLFSSLNIPIGLRYTRLFDIDPQFPDRNYQWSISFPMNLF